MNQEQRIRYHQKAHAIVANAIAEGGLIPQPCEDCGTTDGVEGHHDDYDKPLEVRWLCLRCHRALHITQKSNVDPRRNPIRSIRLAQRLSQVECAVLAGCTQGGWGHWEGQQDFLSLNENAKKQISKALGTDVEAMVIELKEHDA